MSKFNQSKTSQDEKDLTINLAGGEAYELSPKQALVNHLLTSFVQNQAYRTEAEGLDELSKLIAANDAKFVAKAAVYARTKFGMRSVTHVTAAQLAKRVKGEAWTKNFFDQVTYRADDMMEILAYYKNVIKGPVPNSVKKGFAKAFARFNEYQLAKYKKSNSEFSLVDVVNLVHPKANPFLTKLMKGTLGAAETWETTLTKVGQSAAEGEGTDAEKQETLEELKGDAWAKLVTEKKLPYFALLRNVRNILQNAPEVIDQVCEALVHAETIKKSLVLPFRFNTALRAIKSENSVEARKVQVAISKAIEISLGNVPDLPGKTLVVVDTSGSMMGSGYGMGGRQTDAPIEIAATFAAALYKKLGSDLMLFDTSARYINPNPADSLITIRQNIIEKAEGGGTDFRIIFKTASKAYDRIVILSDMQGWLGYDSPVEDFKAYRQRTSSNPFVYSWDLQGNSTAQFPERKIFCLAGFSDKVFNTMALMESDRDALIKEIEKINFD